jgi:hypothetical protein
MRYMLMVCLEGSSLPGPASIEAGLTMMLMMPS